MTNASEAGQEAKAGMTPEQAGQMEAGAELDALVAICSGWRKDWISTYAVDEDGNWCKACPVWLHPEWTEHTHGIYAARTSPPPFSHNMNDAMRAAEAVGLFLLSDDGTGEGCHLYHDAFRGWVVMNGDAQTVAIGETAALAIARAVAVVALRKAQEAK